MLRANVLSAFALVAALCMGAQPLPRHNAFLTEDGAVWTFGDNSAGQLGDGSLTSRTAPAPLRNVPPIRAVATGSDYTLALDAEGTIWVWGANWRNVAPGYAGRLLPTPVRLNDPRRATWIAVRNDQPSAGNTLESWTWGDSPETSTSAATALTPSSRPPPARRHSSSPSIRTSPGPPSAPTPGSPSPPLPAPAPPPSATPSRPIRAQPPAPPESSSPAGYSPLPSPRTTGRTPHGASQRTAL